MKQIVCYYYEPNSNIRHYFMSHTEKEQLFLKLKKTYSYEPKTNIKRYFISHKDIVRLFIQFLQ